MKNTILLCLALFSLLFVSVSQAQDKQLMCLAKNIYYEAGAEPLAGKKAVAQVTINRSNHPSYPSSICGVVHQRTKKTCQFSWVCEPRKPIKTASDNWQESLMVAEMFLTGSYEYDRLTSDTLFFHTKQLPFTWKRKYKQVAVIGNHIFYRTKAKHANKG